MTTSTSRSVRIRRPVAAAERAALLANPGFGRIFTDHMVTIRYAEGKGWYEPRVEARAPIPMDPATAVLHYAQEIFEGLKAYTHAGRRRGDVPAGRQRRPVRRSRPSGWRCRRCREEMFLESLRQIITIDREWIPQRRGRQPLPAPVRVRQRGLPRRAPGDGVPLPGDRLAGGRVLHRRRQAGHGVGHAGLHPGGARRHRRGQVRRQLRGRPLGPGRGASSTAATRSSTWTRCERKYVDELGGMNVFFVHGRRPPGDAAADRHDPARHHPRLGHQAGPAGRPPGRGAAGQLRRVARRARPPAGSGRRSPAARPR